MTNKEQKILIVGGGFGGVSVALELAKIKPANVKVVLVSEREHFEYHGAMYRMVAGKSPMEVCIPLADIFDVSRIKNQKSLLRQSFGGQAKIKKNEVEVCVDRIVEVDLKKRVCEAESGSKYKYDYLVLGLGSETEYYNTPGLERLSFGFKTIKEALELKKHLHEVITSCGVLKDKEKQQCNAHVVVVGGGASGTELAAELSLYLRKMAKSHGVDPTLVTVDLIQSPGRLVPNLPEKMSTEIEAKVRSLGVNVFLHRKLVREQVEKVYLKDMEMKAKTVVWTAGVRANSLYEKAGFELDEKKRVKVNKFLQAKGNRRVFVVGDGASTKESGMAQTALADGKLAAFNVMAQMEKKPKKELEQKKPIYSIPCGPGWAATKVGERQFYGKMGWILRRYLDWVVFRSLLPTRKAWRAWVSGGKSFTTCRVCRDVVEDNCEKK